MTIVTHTTVRAAFERALSLHPDREDAMRAAAAALCIPFEAVRHVIYSHQEEPA